jgi:endoglucanase
MKQLFYIFTILFLMGFCAPGISQNAFNKGVNLTGWFSSGSARSIPFYKYTKKDLENIKSLGCDVIRLPINLHFMTSGQPDYKVDTMLYHYLDQVIAWTDELGLKLILDNHTIDGANVKTVEAPLIKIWPQMARHYKNAPASVIYEILNEPNTFAASDWARIQSIVLDSIRSIDTLHTVIVTGADWGGIYGLTQLIPLKDKKLIYSFHFYDPFLFTHQAATWASPSLGDLGNVPFPYNAARMPACPASLKGTWVEGSLNTSYKTDGTVAKLKSTIDQAINFGKKYNVPIFCGELGVYIAKSPVADRDVWYKAVTGYLTEKSVPWTMWDYQGGFGLFNKGSNETFEYDINRTMAEGMGFTLPPYKEFVMKPDTASFNIYTDFMGEGLQYGGVPSGGVADLFAKGAYEGNNCVYLTGTPQYGALDFDFTFNKDLSMLRYAGSYISLWIKGSAKDASVTLRFLDTKTADPNDHPWRMDYTLMSTTNAPFDGKWYNITIPLKSFQDIGSWDGAWFSSQNKFDWKSVDKFQIVAEQAALSGKEFWLDNIKLIRGESPLVGNREIQIESEVNVYPNPASEKVKISFYAASPGKLEITIHDLSGRIIKTLYNGDCSAGVQQLIWNLNNETVLVQNGIYFCRIRFDNQEITRKISVAK